MGNAHSIGMFQRSQGGFDIEENNRENALTVNDYDKVSSSNNNCICQQRELHYLKEEVKNLRLQIKELNARHYEAMETADSHWVELEKEYKQREETYRSKEICLKQKISKLQDCLRDDARAANEKIQQLEETEQGLKTCLVRITKEHKELLDNHKNALVDLERIKEQQEAMRTQQKPLEEALDAEKKRNKSLIDELTFTRKLQNSAEEKNIQEVEAMRASIYEMKKQFLHIEVTNGELKEEVATLEAQIEALQIALKEYEDKSYELQDELRAKEEVIEKLEKKVERGDISSLAQEHYDSPMKRFKREDVKDLKTARTGLVTALQNIEKCERELSSQMQFQSVALDVKRLADTLLGSDNANEDVSITITEDENTAKEDQNQPNGSISPKEDVNLSIDTDDSKKNLSNEEKIYTVAMALMPQMTINSSMLPSCSIAVKKQICEVPSELRKLSLKPQKLGPADVALSQKRKKKNRRKQPYKYSLRGRLRRIVSMRGPHRAESFFDASEVDFCRSEILQNSISYASFHSVASIHSAHSINTNSLHHPMQAELFEPLIGVCRIDSITQTEYETVDKGTETMTEMIDKQTEVVIKTSEFSSQVDDEMNWERRFEMLPLKTRNFMNALQQSVSKTFVNMTAFNCNLLKRWEADKEFRDNLELLRQLGTQQHNSCDDPNIELYENFVSAMSSLHILEELFKPIKLPILLKLEEEINERLMSYHTKKMESEFVCTVFYQVPRTVKTNIPNFVCK